jgi:hypothetical protein
MIHRIATILKDRIAAYTYVDKIGGLTRIARQQREGREVVIPVAGDVDEAYACDPATIRDMVPDDRYGCMVYFEDRGTTRITERTRGTSYRASLRLVCWVNTLKFGSDPMTADRILEQFVNDLNVGQPYNTDTLIGLKHSVEGFPQRGASIFSQYTYPEAARQYLLWPFDAFALDITATYRIKPGCEEAPVPDDDACWTPPVTKKRRNPSEFTCDELTDPATGLTAAQLGPECLDCEGGGPCPPTTVNGTESDTPTILVQQGGVNVGTLNPATGVHTVPECDPCPPCDPLTVTLDGVEIVNEADPCGVDVELTCADTVDAVWVNGAGDNNSNGIYIFDGYGGPAGIMAAKKYRNSFGHIIAASDFDGPEGPFGWTLYDSTDGQDYSSGSLDFSTFPSVGQWISGSGVDPAPTVRQATIGDICGGGDCPACEDVTVQLRDSAGNNIGAADVYPAGTTTTKTAPDASWTLKDQDGNTLDSGAIASGGAADIVAPDAKVQLLDSAGNNIGSSNSYLSGSINNLTAPDGTFRTTDGLTTIAPVKSNGTADAPQTQVPYKDAANADQLTTAEDTVFASGTLRPDTIIPRITIYESDGVTVQGYTDIGNPFYTVDACPPSAPAFVKFIWQAGDADTYLWTVTADEAGTYGTYTPTGTNGTLTYSKNGGGYAALSGAITLAVSDTITVRRTTTTNAGSVKWEA